MTLSIGDVKAMRTDANKLLPDTAVFSNATKTSDSQGGHTFAYVVSGTVSCRFEESSAVAASAQGENVRGEHVTDVSRWLLTVPADTSFDANDRVEVRLSNPAGTVNAEINYLYERASWEVVRRAKCSVIAAAGTIAAA